MFRKLENRRNFKVRTSVRVKSGILNSKLNIQQSNFTLVFAFYSLALMAINSYAGGSGEATFVQLTEVGAEPNANLITCGNAQGNGLTGHLNARQFPIASEDLAEISLLMENIIRTTGIGKFITIKESKYLAE